MIPAKVQFTGLEFLPEAVTDRWHRGIIPLQWPRFRFIIDINTEHPVTRFNRWLYNNIEGRWAIWTRIKNNVREVNLAFENDFDGITFVLADGQTDALREDL